MIDFMRIYCWKGETEARQKSAVMTNKGFVGIFFLHKHLMYRFLGEYIAIDALLGGEGPDGKILKYVDLPFTRLNQKLLEGFKQGGLKVDQFPGVESFYDWQKSS